MPYLGRYVYALGAVGLGIVAVAWQDFVTVWQPVPDGLAARKLFAILAGLCMAGGGVLVAIPRSRAVGAGLVGAVYAAFALLWTIKIVEAPDVFNRWAGLAEQTALVSVALVLATGPGAASLGTRRLKACQLAFGVSVIAFGTSHLVYAEQTASMVPAWLPPDQRFWVILTGVAHIAGGLAIASGLLAELAACLLTAMFASFGALIWLPALAAAPLDRTVLTGNFLNLALVGAVWVMRDALTFRGQNGRGQLRGDWHVLDETLPADVPQSKMSVD